MSSRPLHNAHQGAFALGKDPSNVHRRALRSVRATAVLLANSDCSMLCLRPQLFNCFQTVQARPPSAVSTGRVKGDECDVTQPFTSSQVCFASAFDLVALT